MSTATSQTPSNQRFLLKATLLITSTLTVMAGATISPSLPAMQEAFADVENAEFLVRLVLTLPALFIVIGAPIAGYIVDNYGRKTLLVIATLAYGISGGSGFLAPTLTTILIGRAFLGLSVAGVMTSVTTLIADYYEGKQRASFLGLQAAFMGLGGTLFLTLGGVLADVDWRAPFLIYASSLFILPLIITLLYEPTTSPKENPIHKPLAETSDSIAETKRKRDEKLKREHIPLRLMGFVYIVVVLIQIVFYLIPVQLPFYLQNLTEASASQSGLAIALMTFFFAFASSLFGKIDERISHTMAVVFAFLLTGLGYLIVSVATSWELILIGLPLGGFGIGLLMPNLNVWLANETPTLLRGRALGGFTTAVFLGQFLSPIVLQPLVNGVGIGGTLGIVGILLLILGVITFIIWKQLTTFLTGK